MASAAFFSANRRICGSLAVNAPSLKTGCVKRFTVVIGTFMPVAFSAPSKRATMRSRSAATEPKGTRSSSWSETP